MDNSTTVAREFFNVGKWHTAWRTGFKGPLAWKVVPIGQDPDRGSAVCYGVTPEAARRNLHAIAVPALAQDRDWSDPVARVFGGDPIIVVSDTAVTVGDVSVVQVEGMWWAVVDGEIRAAGSSVHDALAALLDS